MTTTDTNVQNLIINTMTKAIYDDITPSATELYLITDESPITSSDVTTALDYTPQDSSTAVTHTASTAVGNSTTPVYIASNGTATACSRSLLAISYDSTTQTLTIS